MRVKVEVDSTRTTTLWVYDERFLVSFLETWCDEERSSHKFLLFPLFLWLFRICKIVASTVLQIINHLVMLFVKWCCRWFIWEVKSDMIDWDTEETIAFFSYRYRWGSAAWLCWGSLADCLCQLRSCVMTVSPSSCLRPVSQSLPYFNFPSLYNTSFFYILIHTSILLNLLSWRISLMFTQISVFTGFTFFNFGCHYKAIACSHYVA